MIAYGEEGKLHPGSLTVTDNLILNDRHGGKGIWNDTSTAASMSGNEIYGLSSSALLRGPGSVSGNIMLSSEPALGSRPGSSSGMSFITGSSSSSSSQAPSESDVTSTVANSSDGPMEAVMAGAVGPSDFVTDDGSVMICRVRRSIRQPGRGRILTRRISLR